MENLTYANETFNESGRSTNRDLECLEEEIKSCMEAKNVCNVNNSDIFKSIIELMEKKKCHLKDEIEFLHGDSNTKSNVINHLSIITTQQINNSLPSEHCNNCHNYIGQIS